MTRIASDALAPWNGTSWQLANAVRWALFDRAAEGRGRSEEGKRLGEFVRHLTARWAARAISGGDGSEVTDDERAQWLGREAGVNAVWLRLLQEGCLQPEEISTEALKRIAGRTGWPLSNWPMEGIGWIAGGLPPVQRTHLLRTLVGREGPDLDIAGLG